MSHELANYKITHASLTKKTVILDYLVTMNNVNDLIVCVCHTLDNGWPWKLTTGLVR